MWAGRSAEQGPARGRRAGRGVRVHAGPRPRRSLSGVAVTIACASGAMLPPPSHRLEEAIDDRRSLGLRRPPPRCGAHAAGQQADPEPSPRAPGRARGARLRPRPPRRGGPRPRRPARGGAGPAGRPPRAPVPTDTALPRPAAPRARSTAAAARPRRRGLGPRAIAPSRCAGHAGEPRPDGARRAARRPSSERIPDREPLPGQGVGRRAALRGRARPRRAGPARRVRGRPPLGPAAAPPARRAPARRSDRGLGPGRMAGARPRRSVQRPVRRGGRRGWGRWRRAATGAGARCAGR
jgi:hypothetical protein